jgi:hypothetical protein
MLNDLEALHKLHNFDGAFRYVVGHATRYQVMVWALGTAIVFAMYFVFVEIDEYMGKRGVIATLFRTPQSRK